MATKQSSVETYTIKDLRTFKLSKALTGILQNSALDDDGFGTHCITLQTFFYTALTQEGLSDTAATAFGSLFDPNSLSNPSSQSKNARNGPTTAVSKGLYQAFQDASQLRAQTSGKDDYIGLRHVLFSLATSQAQPLHANVEDILSATNVNRPQAIKAIAAYCLKYAEKKESQEVWDKILGDLGLKRDDLQVETTTSLRADGIAVLQADDPWSEDVTDHSGANKEAEAFAAMICAKQFKPPLAVGVFGDWGSGKSFFMKLVHQAIEKRTNSAPDSEDHAPDGEKDSSPSGVVEDTEENSAKKLDDREISFLQHIVQIRFNAWHYAESNLWASLVDNIFTSLDDWARKHNSMSETEKVFRKLTSAKKLTIESVQTLVDRRREELDAKGSLILAEQELAEKREELEKKPATFARTAWEKVFGNETQKAAMKNAAQTLGLGAVGNGAEDLAAAVKGLDGELARFGALRSGVVRSLTLPLTVTVITAGIVVLPPLFASLADCIHDGLSPIAAAVSGVFAPLALALTWAARKTQSAMGVVTDFRGRFERQIELDSAGQMESEEQAREDLASAKAAAEEAQNAFAQASRNALEAVRAYHERTDEGRVLRFVHNRVMGGEYAKQLSFAATVRKDFDELSAMMTHDAETKEAEEAEEAVKERKLLEEQIETLIEGNTFYLAEEEKDTLRDISTVPSQPKAVFQRIVLYIDDLDRCPPDQVINVLQAIHLLLNFRLFVVFVAVDVRWLRNSLTTKYKDLLGSGKGAEGMATPSDYLEKIFQIPYWVRAMEPDATKQILNDLMGPAPARSHEPADLSIPVGKDQPGDQPDNGPDQPTPPPQPKPDKPVPDAPDRRSAVSLDLTSQERAFIEKIAATLDGSPRRTLRFINSYRIIKASLDDAELAILEAQGFAALATLLAISVSADEAYPLIVSALASGRVKDTAALKQLFDEADAVSEPAKGRIRKSLDRLEGHGVDWALMKDYSKTVARFAFHRANGALERVVARLA
ncbi:MAG: P-loop NTPase fold protein [Rhizobiaceae bacterium]|nr:P-loop NTPase fold protein [Rhizobiaceae bacterium]